ncbi:MAG: acyl-CoA dehydrogenase family protein [Gammaproteobacteria bacterium]|nr:acyl-CoA dehydrogenase family protein [Gammaproteobacteria bacterium]
MDFAFTPENERFRAEVREFLDAHVTDTVRAEIDASSAGEPIGPATRELIARIGEQGWIGMSWPEEFGGRNADLIDQYIFEEELARARVPLNLGNFIEQAPAIMSAGTEAQKRYFIPRMVRGEISFALGYTEPSGGTDLASLRTRAVEDADGFVINGQKVFTTRAEQSTHIYLMARTDPDAARHDGISIFLVPMDTPGITVRPLRTLPGGRTNEVFFDDVRVPATALLGDRNRGWYIGAAALNLGRAGARRYCIYVSAFEALLSHLQNDPDGQELARDPVTRDRVAALYSEAQVARLFTMRSLSMVRRGINPPYEISSEKVWGPEFQVRTTEAASQILGEYHQLWDGPLAPANGGFPRNYVGAMVSTFGHGSTQVMRNAIASRGLGMPKSR